MKGNGLCAVEGVSGPSIALGRVRNLTGRTDIEKLAKPKSKVVSVSRVSSLCPALLADHGSLVGNPPTMTALDQDFLQWAVRYHISSELVTETLFDCAKRVARARIEDPTRPWPDVSAGLDPRYPIIVKIDLTKVPVMVNAISAQEYRDAPNEHDWEESFKNFLEPTKGALVCALIPICWKPKALFVQLPVEGLETIDSEIDIDASTLLDSCLPPLLTLLR